MSGFRDKELINRKDYNFTSKLIKTKELGIKIYTKEEFEKLYFI